MDTANQIQTVATATEPYGARNTFGLKDKDGNVFPDIITAYVERINITMEDKKNGYIYENTDRHKRYTLLLDHKTLMALKQHTNMELLVSFQVRMSGCYAIARLPRTYTTTEKDI